MLAKCTKCNRWGIDEKGITTPLMGRRVRRLPPLHAPPREMRCEWAGEWPGEAAAAAAAAARRGGGTEAAAAAGEEWGGHHCCAQKASQFCKIQLGSFVKYVSFAEYR